MRAVVYTESGDSAVLELVERDVPEPGSGEVRVRIHRSGVNPTDWKSRTGTEPGAAVDPPQVPNQDGAGVVEAVGQGVEAALVGAPPGRAARLELRPLLRGLCEAAARPRALVAGRLRGAPIAPRRARRRTRWTRAAPQ